MNREALRRVLAAALAEDLGDAGDLTTEAIARPDDRLEAVVVARAGGRVAGTDVIAATYGMLDDRVAVDVHHPDGCDVEAGASIATVVGPAAPILTGERVALNLLGRLSGIATATAALVVSIAGTGARITDTRKTTPGLRALEKYAVRVGGGSNHRFGLHDAAMVKDNHIALAGGIGPAVEAVRLRVGHTVKVVVEVDDLDQLAELLEVGADVVLLDNMAPMTLAEAVAIVGGRMVTEASGGVTPSTVRAVAESGVDYISVGWITHSAPTLDVALEVR